MLAKMRKTKSGNDRKRSRSRDNSEERGGKTITTLAGTKIHMKNLNPTLADEQGDMKISGGAQRNMVMRKLMQREQKPKVTNRRL